MLCVQGFHVSAVNYSANHVFSDPFKNVVSELSWEHMGSAQRFNAQCAPSIFVILLWIKMEKKHF